MMKFKTIYITVIFVYFFAISACNYTQEKDNAKSASTEIPENNLSFKQVNGIRFYEVKRRFKNGLSFNNIGFQQVPTWVIEFKEPDTMLAYSPEKKGMEAFFLQLDHGKVYNFAREYFRALVINRDSLILQRLQVDGKVIAGDDDERSNVFCTYYSKNFIANKLKTTVGELQKPTPADTVFIKNLSQQTYRDPGNPSIAFAATQPVIFTPKSNFITVEKQSTQDYTTHRTAAYDYLYPEYKIVILRSYKAFAYRLHMVVDTNGKMYVNSVDGVMPEFAESRKKMLQGITDVYLKNLLKITPGTTLTIPHSSQVTVNIVGKLLK